MNDPETEAAAGLCALWPGETRVLRPTRGDAQALENTRHQDVTAVVVMGSAASVYDGMPWQHTLERWLMPIVRGDASCAYLGLCYGHQLLAKLAGGAVDYLSPDQTKRVGVEESLFERSRYLPAGTRVRVMVSHRQHVSRPPEDFDVVATRAGVPVDALEHPTRPLFSVQTHPEAGLEFATRSGIDHALVDHTVRADGLRLVRAFLSSVKP